MLLPPPKRQADRNVPEFKIPKIPKGNNNKVNVNKDNNNKNTKKTQYLFAEETSASFDWVILYKNGDPLPPKNKNNKNDVQMRLELDLVKASLQLLKEGQILPNNLGWKRTSYGTSKPHLTYRLATPEDRAAMGTIFQNLILNKGGAYDRIMLQPIRGGGNQFPTAVGRGDKQSGKYDFSCTRWVPGLLGL